MERQCNNCIHEDLCPLRHDLRGLAASYGFAPGPIFFGYDDMLEALLKVAADRCLYWRERK